MPIRIMSGSFNLSWQDVEPQLREGQTKLRECPGRGGKEFDMKRMNDMPMAKKAVKRPGDFKKHSRFNLQLFDDDPGVGGNDGAADGEHDEKDGKEPDQKDKDDDKEKPRTYTDADVDRIVAKHKKDWEKAHAKDLEDAKEEARKYERMSKEQREEADKKKAAEEAARKDARIKELEQQIATDALRKSVASDVEAMPEGISASQDFLDLVVTGDADAAKNNVKKLVGIILADRKAQEEKRATGRTPKDYGNNGGGAVDPYTAVANKYKR